MKKISILLAISVFLSSCSKPSQSGNVELKNGEGNNTSVEYDISEKDYNELISNGMTKENLRSILYESSISCKSLCKNELTYDPKRAYITTNNDTLIVFFTFQAKNSFGVPGSDMSHLYFEQKTAENGSIYWRFIGDTYDLVMSRHQETN